MAPNGEFGLQLVIQILTDSMSNVNQMSMVQHEKHSGYLKVMLLHVHVSDLLLSGWFAGLWKCKLVPVNVYN